MARIGSGWNKETKENKKFISISLNEDLLPLLIGEDKFLTLWYVPKEDRKKNNSPQWSVSLTKSKEKDAVSECEDLSGEIPF